MSQDEYSETPLPPLPPTPPKRGRGKWKVWHYVLLVGVLYAVSVPLVKEYDEQQKKRPLPPVVKKPQLPQRSGERVTINFESVACADWEDMLSLIEYKEKADWAAAAFLRDLMEKGKATILNKGELVSVLERVGGERGCYRVMRVKDRTAWWVRSHAFAP